MNLRSKAAFRCWRRALYGLTALVLAGCATSSANWDERVGVYTWDEAMTELGTPARVTEQEGGVKTAEWITERTTTSSVATDTPAYLRGESVRVDQLPGRTIPPKILTLSFTPDGKLLDWSRSY